MTHPDIPATYDALAATFSDHAAHSVYNQGCERPAMLARLAADMTGQRVLDVGCASGFYLRELAGRGADVVGVDVSGEMIRTLRERMGTDVELYAADIAGPTNFLASDSFDGIIASLVLHSIRDWDPLFAKFHRLLRPQGRLLLSTQHPWTDYGMAGGANYFEREEISMRWKAFGVNMPSYRRSLTDIFQTVRRAGFVVDHLEEPAPLPEWRERAPASYDKMLRRPPFLILDCGRGE